MILRLSAGLELVRSASNFDSAEAIFLIGQLYYFGKGVSEDKQTRLHVWKLAPYQGHPGAMADFGWALPKGD
jgi:TPR repeat protein